jgi:hypothetical protein
MAFVEVLVPERQNVNCIKMTEYGLTLNLGEHGLSFFLNWYREGWSTIGSTRHCGH